ncbi:MAG: hypothetical protein GYB68_06415 [Chloroflexi bacterium]|nr:hypothetical protein [Chloroflexota bacterium]
MTSAEEASAQKRKQRLQALALLLILGLPFAIYLALQGELDGLAFFAGATYVIGMGIALWVS